MKAGNNIQLQTNRENMDGKLRHLTLTPNHHHRHCKELFFTPATLRELHEKSR